MVRGSRILQIHNGPFGWHQTTVIFFFHKFDMSLNYSILALIFEPLVNWKYLVLKNTLCFLSTIFWIMYDF